MMLSMVSLFVSDLDRSARFYADVLGVAELDYMHTDIFRAFALGDGHLLLGLHGPEAYDILELPRHEGSGAATILTFEATSPADLDAKLETAKLAGAKVVKTPYDTAYGHYQVVLGDPDGHIFRLSVAR